MKQIKLGNREINMIGSPMTPFFYKKEFRQSLSGDIFELQEMQHDNSKFDDINVLQMIWAMEKTSKMGDLKDFESWLGDFEYFDIFSVIEDVLIEAMNATFCESKDHAEKQSTKSTK